MVKYKNQEFFTKKNLGLGFKAVEITHEKEFQ